MTLFAQVDVGFAREPRMVAAGAMARLLYVQAILYCRENLTDGVIDAWVLPLVAVDIRTPGKHMARLVEVGALEVIPGGWRIPLPVWRKWNPLAAEVAAKRDAENERKRRWKERVTAATIPEESRQRDMSRDASRVAESERRDALPEPEPEPEQENLLTSQTYSRRPVDNSRQEENPSAATRRSQVIADHVRIAETAADQRGDTIRNREAWRQSIATKAGQNPDLDRWLDLFPTAPTSALAAWMHGEKASMAYWPRADELATVTELRPGPAA